MKSIHDELHKHFSDGDWVFGLGDHKGCSEVFTSQYGDFQPFDYLNDYDPANYRLATPEEIKTVTSQPWYNQHY